MKTQSSLEVPKQVRSASFDEMQLEAKRISVSEGSADGAPPVLLKVPNSGGRSKSVDSGAPLDDGTCFLEVPARKFNRRRASSDKPPVYCVHCQYIDDIAKFHQSISVEEESVDSSLSLESLSSLLDSTSSSSSCDSIDSGNEAEEEESNAILSVPIPCSITVTLSPTAFQETASSSSQYETESDVIALCQPNTERRKSITSPKLERQAAFVALDTNHSLESVADVISDSDSDFRSAGIVITDRQDEEPIADIRLGGSDGDVQTASCISIFLTVPDVKRDRAASVDSCFSKVSQGGKAEEVKVDSLEPQGNSLRSRSVDIVLPTDEQARYKALALSHRPQSTSSSPRG